MKYVGVYKRKGKPIREFSTVNIFYIKQEKKYSLLKLKDVE